MMGPRKSPSKSPRKGKSSDKSSDSNADTVVIETNVSKKKSNSKKSNSTKASSPSKFKKTAKRSLIKNPNFDKSQPGSSVENSESNNNAPWFSSLVRDVASVLGKENSPLKRKLLESSSSPSKRQRFADEEFLNEFTEDDSYYGLEDEDYYDDQFGDNFNDFNSTNNANSGGPALSQKKELLNFMEDFMRAFDNKQSNKQNVSVTNHRPSCSKNGDERVSSKDNSKSGFDQHNFGQTSQVPFATADESLKQSGESFSFPTPFGCLNLGHASNDGANFVKSLKQDRHANKVAENFLQLAGLSQSESSDIFRKANAKKSGEHRKPSDSAPIEIRWPQEMLERPRGSEVGYNDLSVAEFISGNLALMESGLPHSKYYALVRAQLNYFLDAL